MRPDDGVNPITTTVFVLLLKKSSQPKCVELWTFSLVQKQAEAHNYVESYR
jgi:hypothetical protein